MKKVKQYKLMNYKLFTFIVYFTFFTYYNNIQTQNISFDAIKKPLLYGVVSLGICALAAKGLMIYCKKRQEIIKETNNIEESLIKIGYSKKDIRLIGERLYYIKKELKEINEIERARFLDITTKKINDIIKRIENDLNAIIWGSGGRSDINKYILIPIKAIGEAIINEVKNNFWLLHDNLYFIAVKKVLSVISQANDSAEKETIKRLFDYTSNKEYLVAFRELCYKYCKENIILTKRQQNDVNILDNKKYIYFYTKGMKYTRKMSFQQCYVLRSIDLGRTLYSDTTDEEAVGLFRTFLKTKYKINSNSIKNLGKIQINNSKCEAFIIVYFSNPSLFLYYLKDDDF